METSGPSCNCASANPTFGRALLLPPASAEPGMAPQMPGMPSMPCPRVLPVLRHDEIVDIMCRALCQGGSALHQGAWSHCAPSTSDWTPASCWQTKRPAVLPRGGAVCGRHLSYPTGVHHILCGRCEDPRWRCSSAGCGQKRPSIKGRVQAATDSCTSPWRPADALASPSWTCL
jgi:hypothetical protein